jgi:hypothetical protein
MLTLTQESVTLKPHSVFFDGELPCVNFFYKKEKFCLLWTTMSTVSMFFDITEETDVIETIKQGCDKLLLQPLTQKSNYHIHYGIIEWGFHKQTF